MSDGLLTQLARSWANGRFPTQFLQWVDRINGNVSDFLQLPNQVAGPLGAGFDTVDRYGFIMVNQTVAGPVALTIPFPSNLTPGQRVTIANNGTQTFTINGFSMAVNVSSNWVWNGAGWLHNT